MHTWLPDAGSFKRGLVAVLYRDTIRTFHHPGVLLSNLLNPLIYFFVLGVGLNSIVTLDSGSATYSQFLIPGIIAQVVYMHALMSGLSIIWDRESGYLRELLTAPVGRLGILSGKLTSNIGHTLLQLCVLAPLAVAYGIKIGFLASLTLIGFLAIISTTVTAVGVLIALRVRSSRGFQTVVHYLNFPLLYLSGVYFPLETAPKWIGLLCLCNPLTYCVDAIRRTLIPSIPAINAAFTSFTSAQQLLIDLTIIVVMLLATLPLAAFLFDRQEGLYPGARQRRNSLGARLQSFLSFWKLNIFGRT